MKITTLQQQGDELGSYINAGEARVREIIQTLDHIDLPDLKAQQTYLNQRLAKQQDAALKLSRLQKVATEWQHRVGKDKSEEFVGTYLKRCKVVGATCIGIAAKGEVSDAEFDWVIVDEAGRATHPELLVPLVRGRKIILVGAHCQLPPILDQELKNELLEEIEIRREDLETRPVKRGLIACPGVAHHCWRP